MNIANILVEHLLSGVQSLVWMGLLLALLFNLDVTRVLQLANGLDGAIGLFILALPIAYPLGVALDNIADAVFKPWHNRIKHHYINENGYFAMALVQKADNENFAQFLEYIRSRIKVSRSSAINFALTTILAAILASKYQLRFEQIAAILFIGGALVSLLVWSWQRNTVSYYQQSAKMLKHLEKSE